MSSSEPSTVASSSTRGSDAHPLRVGQHAVAVDGDLDDARDRHVLGVVERVVRLDAREVDERLRHAGEAVGLELHALRERAHPLGVGGGGLDRLGEHGDRADGGLQLVADVGDEVAAHAGEAQLLGAVGGEHEHEAVAERRDPHPQVQLGADADAAAAVHEVEHLLLARAPDPAHRVEDLVRAQRPAVDEVERDRAGRREDDLVGAVDARCRPTRARAPSRRCRRGRARSRSPSPGGRAARRCRAGARRPPRSRSPAGARGARTRTHPRLRS